MTRREVRRTYDRIADHFSKTREHPWPEVESFLPKHDAQVALDLGCGNGRHVELLAERADRVLALDASGALLRVARGRIGEGEFGTDLLQGDAADLPIRTGTVGLGVYVATIHHLPDRASRLRSLDELARVLTPDGVALVSAWSTAHDRFDGGEGFDTTLDWTLPDGETVPRFYHIYDPDEFDADLADSDLRVQRSFVSSGNCYAVVGEGKRP